MHVPHSADDPRTVYLAGAAGRRAIGPGGEAAAVAAGAGGHPGRWHVDEDADGGQRYEGGKWIVVDYSRPMLKGRTNIFGSGAEYGKAVSDGAPVWRAGANATTTLTTQVPLMVGGKTLAPGVYNVFVELKPAGWTLDPEQPAAAAEVRPGRQGQPVRRRTTTTRSSTSHAPPMQVDTIDQKLEQFTITFLTVSPTRLVMLAMAWENVAATAPIELAK